MSAMQQPAIKMASGSLRTRWLLARPLSRTIQPVPNEARRSVTTALTSRPRRPLPRHHLQQAPLVPPATALPARGRRTIFIQTEDTPNGDALKFLPNHAIIPPSFPSPFLEYLSPRSTLAPPHPSPLAANLMNVDGVRSVFYGSNFITVTKNGDASWAHIKPEVFALITQAITSGEQIVATVDRPADGSSGQGTAEVDSLTYDAADSEVVGMIKELLETRIRPAIQEDGGDIEFRGFKDGLVALKLRGACRTCDSSTVTLKNGIESMLMHYIEEVKGVNQVLDEEEQVALDEFARFEEKLRQQAAQ